MERNIILAGLIVLFLQPSFGNKIFGQNGKLFHNHEDELQKVIDQTLNAKNTFNDSLGTILISNSKFCQKGLKNFCDSLLIVKSDSLDRNRKDSLISVSNSLIKDFLKDIEKWRSNSKELIAEYRIKLESKKQLYKCENCKTVHDFRKRLNEFSTLAENISQILEDSCSSLMNHNTDNLDNNYSSDRDSLQNFCSTLIDNYQNEKDILNENKEASLDSSAIESDQITPFSLSMLYIDHNTYRARDNGRLLNTVAPTLNYHHSSGFGVSLTGYWILNNPLKKYDETDLSISYDLQFSQYFNATVSYTHFWFADSSAQAKSIINNNFGLDLDYSPGNFELELSYGIDLGTQSESTFNFILSYMFESDNFLSADNFKIGPMLTGIYGEQNELLTQLRRTKVKKKTVATKVTKNSSSFGVLGYVPSLSASYDIKNISVKPFAEWIIPLNVIDQSTDKPFFNFVLEIDYNFK